MVARFCWVFSIFITSTKLKTFKLALTYTKNVREPWLNNENFRKRAWKVSTFRNVHACMITLSIQSLFRPTVLISMPWLHSMKTRHEQQKELNYLKNKSFSKSSIITSQMRVKNCQKNLKKNLILRAILSLFFNR